MKTYHFFNLVAAVFSLAAIFTTGFAAVPAAGEASALPAVEAAGGSNAASARWSDIKDCPFDLRARFFTGLEQLEARVDGQYNELTVKRAAMTSATDTKNWDFAMKEMGDARSYLRSVGNELRKASVETWAQQKETVGQAWVRTQAAYDKVKSSTTN